jgi:hypothetical protein
MHVVQTWYDFDIISSGTTYTAFTNLKLLQLMVDLATGDVTRMEELVALRLDFPLRMEIHTSYARHSPFTGTILACFCYVQPHVHGRRLHQILTRSISAQIKR